MLIKFAFRPGIHKEITDYTNTGSWVDCDKVRFRAGFPERMGGWEPTETADDFTFDGICRSLHSWPYSDLSPIIGVGTDRFFYVLVNGEGTEITPIDRTSSLTDPFETTNGSAVVTVTDTSHGALTDDVVVISGASPVGGLNLSGSYDITFVDDDTYTITASSSATSAATGGGNVTADYILHPGATTGTGWGGGVWSGGTWGISEILGNSGMWTQAQWGEDVVLCARNKQLAYIDTSSIESRATLLSDLPNATGVPTNALMVLSSMRDRHLIALGATEVGGTVQDKMLIRWCDQENLADWVASDTNTAGSIILDQGSYIVTGRMTRLEALIWTDTALYSMSYRGSPYTFGVDLLASNTDIAGFNCAVVDDDVAYWLGRKGIYRYVGAVEKIPCTIWDHIDNDIDWGKADKFIACTNKRFDEVMWLYCSSSADEPDKYFIYNKAQNIWYYGTLERTAWLDHSALSTPVAASEDGILYDHESGADDVTRDDTSAIEAHIQSAPFELMDESGNGGDKIMFARSIYHDITFRDSAASPAPQATMVLKGINRPGSGFYATQPEGDVARTVALPIEQYTEKTDLRLRARAMTLRVESDSLNTLWRLGTPRVDLRPDGRRQ